MVTVFVELFTADARETVGNLFEDHSSPVHVVDWACKSQRHVTRSTFSAELLAAGDAFDQGLLTSHLIYEIEFGPLTAKVARDRRMEGGYIPVLLLSLIHI